MISIKIPQTSKVLLTYTYGLVGVPHDQIIKKDFTVKVNSESPGIGLNCLAKVFTWHLPLVKA